MSPIQYCRFPILSLYSKVQHTEQNKRNYLQQPH